jgi:CDP-diacylglycerol--serine O-phosphatidyltransferase
MIKPISNKNSKISRIQELPFSRLIPNIVTLSSICVGFSSVKFALMDRFELAVTAIFIAAILDTLDGRIARLLGTDSHFGAELDSLADFVCFGAAPALVIYLSSLHHLGNVGWSVVLFFIMCQALRLARFNTDSFKPEAKPPWAIFFFTGIPAPAGALLSLFLLMLGFATGHGFSFEPTMNAVLLVLVGLMMISRIPTFSLKGCKIKQDYQLPLMLAFGATIISFINEPWFTLCGFGMAYVLTIPFSYRLFKKYTASKV